eukprot:jgi/Chlat1/7144/Chrsp57S06810
MVLCCGSCSCCDCFGLGRVDCLGYLKAPILVFGVILFVASFVGFYGAKGEKATLMTLYVAFLIALTLALLGFTVFIFVVSHSEGTYEVPGVGYKEYSLGGYSTWLQDKVNDNSTWSKVATCLQDEDVCQHFSTLQQDNTYSSLNSTITALQGGCCFAPSQCASDPSFSSDCSSFNITGGDLCYNCTSCKASFLHVVHNDWEKAAIVSIIVVICLIALLAISCGVLTASATKLPF